MRTNNYNQVKDYRFYDNRISDAVERGKRKPKGYGSKRNRIKNNGSNEIKTELVNNSNLKNTVEGLNQTLMDYLDTYQIYQSLGIQIHNPFGFLRNDIIQKRKTLINYL